MNDGEPMNELLACSRLFVEIQSMEPLLRGGHCMTITRSGDHVVSVKVYAAGDSRALHRYKVRAKDVTTEDELYAEVNNLWQQLVKMNLTRLEVLR